MPPLAASTKRRVSVAMPDRRCRKLRAVRSAVSISAAEPRTSATTVPGSTAGAVLVDDGDLHRRIELTKRFRGDVEPGEHARRLDDDLAAAAAGGVDRGLGRDVAPTEIFRQGAPHDAPIDRRIERFERDALHASRTGAPSAGASSTSTCSASETSVSIC